MPPDAEMQPGWDAFTTSVQRPATQARMKALFEKGLGQSGDVEKHLVPLSQKMSQKVAGAAVRESGSGAIPK
jgi:hypothetical protein